MNEILARLERARRELLDVTSRNRLIHAPRGERRSSRVEIVGENPDELFRRLVREKRTMRFAPLPDPPGTVPPVSEKTDKSDEHNQRTRLALATVDPLDDHLQTELSDELLQERLLKLAYDARTYQEEQGVNILYLALGFLRWREPDKERRDRFAPLLLLPVQLDRRAASARFQLRWSEEEPTTNLSLQAKLESEFGIELPELPESDEIVPSQYFAAISAAMVGQTTWEVLANDVVLWFFSFSKFLMYRDLRPDRWLAGSSIAEHPLITRLLGTRFAADDTAAALVETVGIGDQPLDPRDDSRQPRAASPPHAVDGQSSHVLDADGSQIAAIELVQRGGNLVIQGPPGTGKSQTIANLIAVAVQANKKVLFVAEKMAALEAVKRRLENIGLGDLCLELHSNKSNKRAVLEDLSRTWSLPRPQAPGLDEADRTASPDDSLTLDLVAHRRRLDGHARTMNEPLQPGGPTPLELVGQLLQLRAAGLALVDFSLEDPLGWTEAQLRDRRRHLEDVAAHLAEVGNPSRHPWRGVGLEAILPTDIERWQRSLPELRQRLEAVVATSQRLARSLSTAAPGSLAETQGLARLAELLAQAPAGDRRALADPVWLTHRDDLGQLVANGTSYARCRERLLGVVAELAWDTDVSEARRELAARGRSLWRWFDARYHRALSTLRGVLEGPLPWRLDERLAILDTLRRGQKARRAVEEGNLGRRAFGSLWRGADSNWSALAALRAWDEDVRAEQLPGNHRRLLSRIDAPDTLAGNARQLRQNAETLLVEITHCLEVLQLDLMVAFQAAETGAVSLEALADRLGCWAEHAEDLASWIAYANRWRRLHPLGLGDLAEKIHQGRIPAEQLVPQLERECAEARLRDVFRRSPELAEFDGRSHENVIGRFVELDQRRMLLARHEVATTHFLGLPGGMAPETSVLRHEMKKQRRHLPLRQLIRQAGQAVLAIKPVFMMSPVSIAQFLEPGAVEFDLLLIDEASQIQPVDALGAIARARQLVVVGDNRQLPPTRFFEKLLTEDESAADGDARDATDLESILGLCEAQGMPRRMLEWHYRSRHPSLIAVSNHEFYDGRLLVVPSPRHDRDESALQGLGLRFVHVTEGVYDRGTTASNRREAEAVAQAVIEHARMTPELSLGVGTFSVAQRDAILSALERLRRRESSCEPFFAAGGAAPFFVKNLENIQGDERDVVFISVGYGRDEHGVVDMNFGPLNRDGGERRLNVLISRARSRCVVFSSMTDEEIDLTRTRRQGPRALKSFLHFARTGELGLNSTATLSEPTAFEQHVASELRARGYEVDLHVGGPRMHVDLAVRHPDRSGRYVLGILCDGPGYRDALSARDRDRLRPAMLQQQGWELHRVWSLDWLRRPEQQLQSLVQAVHLAARRESVGDGRHDSLRESTPSDARAPGDRFDLKHTGSRGQPRSSERSGVIRGLPVPGP